MFFLSQRWKLNWTHLHFWAGFTFVSLESGRSSCWTPNCHVNSAIWNLSTVCYSRSISGFATAPLWQCENMTVARHDARLSLWVAEYCLLVDVASLWTTMFELISCSSEDYFKFCCGSVMWCLTITVSQIVRDLATLSLAVWYCLNFNLCWSLTHPLSRDHACDGRP